jgi:serine/threonine-protein kinase RsbT
VNAPPRLVPLQVQADLVLARLAAREMVCRAGLGVVDQTRFATAVSELGGNALRHAGCGECELSDLSDARHVRLQAQVQDQGPGIADTEKALRDGYSLGGSLGGGLPGARRLVDAFDIHSTPAGTCVRVQIFRRQAP